MSASYSTEAIQAWLTAQIADMLGMDPAELDPNATLDTYGLGSRDAVLLSGDLEDWLDLRLSPTLLYQYPSIASLSAHLAEEKASSVTPVEAPAPVPLPQVRKHSAGISDEPIAIVGMACRFPGAASTAAFWQLVRDGVDAISEVPPLRWDVDALYDPIPQTPGKMNTRWGGFLEDIDAFDAHFFGIAPREVLRMDPQQRLLLEVSWEALEDAGLVPASLAGSATGVFVGVATSDYSHRQLGDPDYVDAYIGTGNAFSMVANRVSFLLDLRGPSLAVDTACSSSLVSVHLACQSLRQQECDTALAGGVNIILAPEGTLSFSQARLMASDGRCKAFDARADGYVRGEGCGMVVLKRLSDAQAHGDRILAVIRATAVNQDGHSNGLTAPNPLSQQACVLQAMANADVTPDDVDYVEAHGTGTALGDLIEVNALGAVLTGRDPARGKVAIGSVKSNIGHLESAAGIASLIKVVLMLQEQQLPPSIHFHMPNPLIPFDKLPLAVQTSLQPWRPGKPGAPRMAGVSSFGFGGTNAHAILQEAVGMAAQAVAKDDLARARRPYVLPVSARSPQALQAAARSMRDYLASGDLGQPTPMDLDAICYTAGLRRSHHDHRLAVVGRNQQELVRQLDDRLQALEPEAARTPAGPRQVAFIFSGQGSQWAGMAQQLLANEPVFLHAVTEVDARFRQLASWSILDELAADTAFSRLDDTEVAQPAIFAVQVGLAALWSSWGIKPSAVTGHSVGEVAAAYVAGVLGLDDAVQVIYHRGRLMQQATGLGKMAAVGLTPQEAFEFLAGYEGRLSLAAINSPNSVVFAGEAEALEEVLQRVQSLGMFCRMLPVNYAFHGPQIEPFAELMAAEVGDIAVQAPTLPLVSTVTGRIADPGDYQAAYWRRNMRSPVRFADAVRTLRDLGCDVVLEIGPHPVLRHDITQVLQAEGAAVRTPAVLYSLRRQQPDQVTLLANLAGLYQQGCTVDWSGLSPQGGRVVSLPTYPWQRQRYWSEVHRTTTDHAGLPLEDVRKPIHPLLHQPVRSPLIQDKVFQATVSTLGTPFLADHRIAGTILFPATAYVESMLAAVRAAHGVQKPVLHEVALLEAMAVPEESARTIQVVVGTPQEGLCRVQVYSASAGEGDLEWALHAVAQMPIARTPEEDESVQAEDLGALRERVSHELEVAAFYDELQANGFEYGPGYRTVQRLWQGEAEALGLTSLPASEMAEAGRFLVHPALLDGCLQLVAAALPTNSRVASPDSLLLPVAMERIQVHAIGPTSGWAHVRLAAVPAGVSEALMADLRLFDDDGRLLAEIDGLRIVQASRAELPSSTREDIWEWLYQEVWQRQDLPARDGQRHETPGLWIILADGAGTGAGLGQYLSQAGDRVVLVRPGQGYAQGTDGSPWLVRPDEPEDFRRLLQEAVDAAALPCRGVVHLWALDAPGDISLEDIQRHQALHTGTALHLVQAMALARWTPPPQLWLVTGGTQEVNADSQESASGDSRARQEPVNQHTLWGLGHVVALEHPELRCVLIDLDPVACENWARELVLEIQAGIAPGIAMLEDRVAYRGGARHVARLMPMAQPQVSARGDGESIPQAGPKRLEINQRGVLDNLALVSMERQAPGPGQVEIQVHATGLNFRDVMNALGLYPGDPGMLGGECSGIVVAVGEGATSLNVGDKVMAIAPGTFASFATTYADLAVKKPENLSFQEAATIPIAFLTAHYALSHLAKISAGDRVLVHAASGGVGLAAVQLAQAAGAQVFGTAGRPEKRDFLHGLGVKHVMSSRSLAFADEIMEATDGQGVDVVLNSLSGEFIPRSLSILTPSGRFLEIGKVGIWSQQEVARRHPGISYHTIALDDLSQDSPQFIQSMLQELVVRLESGRLKPIHHTVYPLEDVVSAFRLMQQTRHIGKIVVSQEPATPVMARDKGAATRSPAQFSGIQSDGTYLVSGGLGALGLLVARWLVDQGAGAVVLVSRREPSEDTMLAVDGLHRLSASGADREAKVITAQADISRRDEVVALIQGLREDPTLPPLRGVIHAAGVLDDGVLLQQTWERFQAVMAPKVAGSWNLHEATHEMALDFFVMFSSVASVLGSPGQGNYAAANAFMDGLARYRRRHGLPALSINWGPWAQVGMAAGANGRGRQRRSASGLGEIPPVLGLEALGYVLSMNLAQATVAPIHWPALTQALPAGAEPAVLASMLEQTRQVDDGAGPAAGELLLRLSQAPREDQRQIIMAYLSQRTAKILGLDPAYPLDVRKPLSEMGMDLLMAIELKNALDQVVGKKLPATLAFEYPNIQAITDYLIADVLELQPATAGEAPKPANGLHMQDPLLDVESLTDEEAEALLLEALAGLEDED